jgi:hypothetical protein
MENQEMVTLRQFNSGSIFDDKLLCCTGGRLIPNCAAAQRERLVGL